MRTIEEIERDLESVKDAYKFEYAKGDRNVAEMHSFYVKEFEKELAEAKEAQQPKIGQASVPDEYLGVSARFGGVGDSIADDTESVRLGNYAFGNKNRCKFDSNFWDATDKKIDIDTVAKEVLDNPNWVIGETMEIKFENASKEILQNNLDLYNDLLLEVNALRPNSACFSEWQLYKEETINIKCKIKAIKDRLGEIEND